MFDDFKDSRELLTELYLNQNKGMETIGEILGVDKTVIRKELLRLGIAIRPKGRPRFPKNIIKLATVIENNNTTMATLTLHRKAYKL